MTWPQLDRVISDSVLATESESNPVPECFSLDLHLTKSDQSHISEKKHLQERIIFTDINIFYKNKKMMLK